MKESSQSPSKAVRSAIEKLRKDTELYDPGSVEIALDAVASTLQEYFKLKKWSPKPPSLRSVIIKLRDAGVASTDELNVLRRIQAILDEHSYPDGVELEETDELENLISDLCDRILELVHKRDAEQGFES